MIKLKPLIPQDLGIEQKEVLGFDTEEELELALYDLMQPSLQESIKAS